jgi:type I restriction enzyme S subunit
MAGEQFEQTTFGDLVSEGALEIGDGYRAKNSEHGGDGLVFLRAGHVTDTHVDFSGVERFHAELEPRVRGKLAKPGDAVVTTKGNSTGRPTFVSPSMPPFVYSPHLSYWRSQDPTRIDGRFLHYWRKGPEFKHQLAGMKAPRTRHRTSALSTRNDCASRFPHFPNSAPSRTSSARWTRRSS